MATTETKFSGGETVELTEDGERMFPKLRGIRATVVGGFRLTPAYIRVKFAGKKRAETWSANLFRIVGS